MIEDLVRRIVEVAHPVRIILFGSAARGEMGPWSDLDVLVVTEGELAAQQAWRKLYPAMRGLGAPIDILVVTVADLERHKNNIGLIYRRILREGREIYAA